MKYTELEQFRLHEALRHAREVLRAKKMKPRVGKEREELRILEAATQHLEAVTIGFR